MSECIVRAISNQKGGVGKTTVCLNLGIGLARQPRLFSSVNRLPRALRREAVFHANSIQAGTFYAGQDGNSETADPIQKANQDSMRYATRTSEQVFKQVGSTVRGGQKKLYKQFRHSSGRQNTKATVRATKAATKAAQRSMQAMARSVRAVARTAIQATKVAVKAIVTTAKATATAVKGLVSLIAAGGWVAVVIVLLIAVIGWLITAPISIFFTGSDDQTKTAQTVMAELAQETADQIAQIKINQGSDRDVKIIYEGSEDGSMIQNGADILAVYSVRISMNPNNPNEVFTMDDQKEAVLQDTYHQMVVVSYKIAMDKTEETTASTETEKTKVAEELQIFVNCRSYEEMISIFQLTAQQAAMLNELMKPEYQMLFQSLVGIMQPDGLTVDEIAQIRAGLPANISIMQQDVVDAALSIVGKVQYFWGGKSTAIGWDNRWGSSMEVTSPGSHTTGTIRPFGLDCSGYAAWVYVNAGIPAEKIADVFGTHTSTQWKCSVPVAWDDAQIGDLSFYAIPDTTKGNHVGVIVGVEGPGVYRVAHCSSSRNGVVIGEAKQAGFVFIRRPYVLG